MPTPAAHPRRTSWWLPAFALAAGVLGMAALWLAASLWLGGYVGWMAGVAAVDMALMLRLSGAPAGRPRAGLAVLGTLASAGFGACLVAAADMGRVVGLAPWESATRLGTVLAWELVRHGVAAWDVLFLAGACVLAWRLSR